MSKDVKDFLDELKEYSNGGIPGLYPPEDTVKELLDYIEKLKETIKGTTYCFDEQEHQRLKQENKELKKINDRLLKENFNLKQHPILIEFEKWLEKQKQNNLNDNFVVIRLADIKAKIQKLKEGNNNGFMDKKSR